MSIQDAPGGPPIDAPQRHRSAARVLGPLSLPPGCALEAEAPLFAGDLDFALARGGPITRAFLEAVALAGELDRDAGVVVDSSLVWLLPGQAHGFGGGGHGRARGATGFVHEPFPGVTTGVRGESNRNRAAVHRLCVLGNDATPELAEGELAFATVEEAAAFWLPTEERDTRAQELERRLADGTLARAPLPLATIVEYGWGALLRPRPATAPGFQLVLRVTTGDRRPHVNGLRNLAQL